MYQQIFEISGPVFLLILLGYLVSKFKIELHEKTMGFLLTHIGSPCLIFHTLSTTNVDINMDTNLDTILNTNLNIHTKKEV